MLLSTFGSGFFFLLASLDLEGGGRGAGPAGCPTLLEPAIRPQAGEVGGLGSWKKNVCRLVLSVL